MKEFYAYFQSNRALFECCIDNTDLVSDVSSSAAKVTNTPGKCFRWGKWQKQLISQTATRKWHKNMKICQPTQKLPLVL